MDGYETDVLGERVSASAVNSRPKNDLILRAMRGERTERTPVWLMRQAGRFDPRYRELRERAGLELEHLFAHPRYAAEITILPVRFGVDAAILFQDILTPLGPMGAPFVFRPGPVLEQSIRSAADADRLIEYDCEVHLAFVSESIRLTLERLNDAVPLLGFAGAPLTLLAFLLEGESPRGDAPRMRAFCAQHSDAARKLLNRITNVTVDYLRMQIDAGVHGVQLFESCAPMFTDAEYLDLALPSQREIFRVLREHAPETPSVLFAKDVGPTLMAESGADVISVGAGVSLGDAMHAMPGGAVQGNVDNQLLLNGTADEVRNAAYACIRAGRHHGHVLNLGHGVLPGTPVANVQAMIDAAHDCVIVEKEGQ